MKVLAYVLGVLTGLAFSRIPHYVGPIFNDQPGTPAGHVPKERYWNGGVPIEGSWPPPISLDPEAFERVQP